MEQLLNLSLADACEPLRCHNPILSPIASHIPTFPYNLNLTDLLKYHVVLVRVRGGRNASTTRKEKNVHWKRGTDSSCTDHPVFNDHNHGEQHCYNSEISPKNSELGLYPEAILLWRPLQDLCFKYLKYLACLHRLARDRAPPLAHPSLSTHRIWSTHFNTLALQEEAIDIKTRLHWTRIALFFPFPHFVHLLVGHAKATARTLLHKTRHTLWRTIARQTCFWRMRPNMKRRTRRRTSSGGWSIECGSGGTTR